MYGAHVECGGDPVLTSLSGKCAPGSVIALRDGAIAIQCGKVRVCVCVFACARASVNAHRCLEVCVGVVLLYLWP